VCVILSLFCILVSFYIFFLDLHAAKETTTT